MLNKVLLVGKIVKSELRKTNSGLAVGEVFLAVTAKKSKTDWETQNMMVTFFGKTAEDITKLTVGSELYVEGKIRVDTYSRDDSTPSSTLKINGFSYDLLKEGKANPTGEAVKGPQEKDEEIPF